MNNVKINCTNACGKVKPMHAVNNGPAGSRVRGGHNTFEYFKRAGIPYARNHDASFYSGYGGEHTVDVHRIFRDFNASPYDEKNYDFRATDDCVADMISVGTKPYYRLGASIEHGIKRGTYPPADFKKWAVICEHIIRHYNEGWANGFEYNIEYWEIWNEPDCTNADGSNPCWQGTVDEFVEFFATALGHLKKRFPDLKIGGPAFASINTVNRPKKEVFMRKLFGALKERNIPLDFFSFHRYTEDPSTLVRYINFARSFCDEYGYTDTELHLNEWNYIRSFLGDNWTYSIKAEKGLKGSSFIAGAMAVGCETPLDMLMYYDARPCAMNGMFNTDFLYPLKGYYPFEMFGKLYRMGEYVKPEYEFSPIYCVAAKGEDCAGIMVTNFADDDDAPSQRIELSLAGVNGKTATVYTLDENNDMAKTDEFEVSDRFELDLPLFTTCYIEIK